MVPEGSKHRFGNGIQQNLRLKISALAEGITTLSFQFTVL
jgi:hypothetical protein